MVLLLVMDVKYFNLSGAIIFCPYLEQNWKWPNETFLHTETTHCAEH